MARTQPPDRSEDLWDDLDDADELAFVESAPPAAAQPRVPWYQSGPAVAAMAAIGLGVIAIVVSMTLLSAFDGSDSTPEPVKRSTSQQPSPAPSSEPEATTTATTTSPSPSPTESSVEETSAEPPPPETNTPDDGPEINVTRTQVTRSPISVAPPRRSP